MDMDGPEEYHVGLNGGFQVFRRGELGWYMAHIMYRRGEQLERVADWAERHAEHAGRAPLAELRAILDGD